MISLKDIQESDISIKAMAIWLLILPFWFVAFYIYFPSVYKLTLIIPTSLGICFAIIGGIISASTLHTIANLQSNDNQDKDENNSNEDNQLSDQETLGISGLGVLLQAILLSLLIFFGYLFSKITDYIFTFFGFISFYFGILLIIFFLITTYSVKNKNEDKDKSNSQNTPNSNK